MGELTAGMLAALSSDQATVTAFLQVDLPGYPLRLMFGSGAVPWNGGTFLSEDPVYGILSALRPPEDGMGDEAPSMSFTLIPSSDAAAADLASASFQLSRVRLWLATLDAAGGVVPDPWNWYDGFLDQPVLGVDRGSRDLEYDCVSDMDKLFANEEGRRLSDASHQEIWPGETGLSFMSGTNKTVIWGPGDRPGGVTYGGGIQPTGNRFIDHFVNMV